MAGVLFDVVELAFGAVVGFRSFVDVADPAVGVDGVHLDLGVGCVALVLGEHVITPLCRSVVLRHRQRSPFHPLGHVHSGDLTDRGGDVDEPDRSVDVGGRDVPGRRWLPECGAAGDAVDQGGSDEEQAVVAVQAAMVGCEDDVGVVEPAFGLEVVEHPCDGVVHDRVLDVDVGVDLADLVGVVE